MSERTLCGDEWMALVATQQGDKEVSFIRADDEALILPLTQQGEVIFILEPAPARGQDVLLLPGGTIDSGELPPDSANRELQEEIGFKAKRLDLLGRVRPWSKYLTTVSHLYLARDLVPATLTGDEDYAIRVQRAPLAGFEALITDGRLQDARVIAALFLAREFLAVEQAAHPTTQP